MRNHTPVGPVEPADRVALVTGSGSGIGESIAETFAAAGTAVAIVDRNRAEAERVASQITDRGYQAIALRADVSNAAQVRAAWRNGSSPFVPPG